MKIARRPLRLLVRAIFLVVALSGLARTAETIPPAPRDYFNDYANVVRPDTARELDARLAAFKRETSNQIVFVLYPRMETDSSVEDYTIRILDAWKAAKKGVGQKGRDNGAVLFAFMEQRQLYLQVGYGLEGAIPDALAKRIIEDEIVPSFRAGDRDGGMRAAAEAILAATRGEYRGTGRTVADGKSNGGGSPLFIIIVVLIFFALPIFRSRRGGHIYSSSGRRSSWGGSGTSWGGGGGGGGFSGGGGSFGGGGAGGRW